MFITKDKHNLNMFDHISYVCVLSNIQVLP